MIEEIRSRLQEVIDMIDGDGAGPKGAPRCILCRALSNDLAPDGYCPECAGCSGGVPPE